MTSLVMGSYFGAKTWADELRRKLVAIRATDFTFVLDAEGFALKVLPLTVF